MAKYARPVDHSTAQDGSDVRMIDVVTVQTPLPPWAANDADWLSKMYGATANQFVLIPDSIQPCAKYNGGGYGNPSNYTNPGASPTPQPVVYTSRKAVRRHLVSQLGGGSTGEIRLGAIIKGIKGSTDERVNYAWDYFSSAMDFEKAEIVGLFQLARAKDLPSADTSGANVARKVEAAEITAISNNWPEV